MIHLHIVDSGEQQQQQHHNRGATTAAHIMAHLTLRCGHLRDAVVVSASSTTAASSPSSSLAGQMMSMPSISASSIPSAAAAAAAAGAAGASDDGELAILRTAAALLKGASLSADAPALPYLAGHGVTSIVPYSFWNTPFCDAERSLAAAHRSSAASSSCSIAPYFDLIAAVDTNAYEALCNHYQQLRLRGGGTPKRVGIFLVMCHDTVRLCGLVQHFVEALLPKCGSDREASSSSSPSCSSSSSWLDQVDDAVTAFAQTLSVDVLLTVV